MKPICYDLFCGLGGWSEAFLAEGDVPALMPHTFKGTKIPNQGLEQHHPQGISPQRRAKKYGFKVDGRNEHIRGLDCDAGCTHQQAGAAKASEILSEMGRARTYKP